MMNLDNDNNLIEKEDNTPFSFDEVAEDYRQIHNENLQSTGLTSDYFAEMKILKIKNNINKKDKIRILEVGCGDGKLAEYINKYFENYDYIGLDISSEEIKIAKDKNIKNTNFIAYDGYAFPFEKDSFDIIILAQVLHHIGWDNHNNILSQCYKVLDKEGNLFIFEHNPINPFTKQIVRTCVFDKDAKLLPHKYIKNILKENKFNIIDFEFITFFPNKFIFKYLIKYEYLLKKCIFGGQYYIKIQK